MKIYFHIIRTMELYALHIDFRLYNIMKKYIVLGSTMALAPILVFAVNAEDILDIFSDLLGVLMPILISLAVIYFVYSLVQFMLKEGEEKAAAKTSMIWGVIILFAMVSVWGLVNVLGDTFDLDTAAPTLDWEVK